ncbi:MAG: polysaccharide biosynthesis protein [Lachnospiraceae bacterium]
MRLDKTKNAKRNLKWGLLYRLSGILVPFVCKAGIIRVFGINYLGLNQLFSSILNALNLAELGFGSTVVFFMYEAIANEDTGRMQVLLAYFRKVYRIIGTIIILIGVALIPFLKFLIKRDIPNDVNIYYLYLISLIATSISYLLYGFENSILTAHQRSSVIYVIQAFVLLTESILQIIAVFILKNYYAYLLTNIIAVVATNILVHKSVRKEYPQYYPSGEITIIEREEIGNKIRGLFYYKLGGVIISSADSIIISAYLGLNSAGTYGNYYYIITLLNGLFTVYYASFRAGLGNSIVMESIEKNYSYFKKLQFMQNWIVAWCTICLLCMYQDFIYLYAGEKNVLPYGVVICLSILFFVWKIQDVVNVYKEACGLWTEDRYRPIIGALINFVLNIVSVQFCGLYGVVLSTVVVLATLDLAWAPRALFSKYFDTELNRYYQLIIAGIINFIIMFLPTYFFVSFIDQSSHLIRLIVISIICILVPNTAFIACNYKKEEFKDLKDMICKSNR